MGGNNKLPVWFVVLEILFLFLLFQGAAWLVRVLHLPFPPALLGMAVLFVLLTTGRVKVRYLEGSSRFFVRHLVLLLLPAIAGVIQFYPLLEREGWKLGVILVLSTAAVLVSTAGIARAFKKGRDG